VVIDEDLLLEAVRDVHQAPERADATNVTVALGPRADDGDYWDVTNVANDLAELESLGKHERASAFPVTLPEADGTPQPQDDITQESTGAAAAAKGGRSFAQRIGSGAVWLPLACVAALLVGFGTMTGVLRLADWPGQSDTKPVPTTAAPVVPPSPAAPIVTTPPASAAPRPSVENEPAPPAPASESPPVSAPNLNPAGHAPPGQNK
jgi:hypothetical protein